MLDHSYFYPIKHIDRMILFQSNKPHFWERLFHKAVSVHFYGSNTSGRCVRCLTILNLLTKTQFARGGWTTGRSTAYDYLGKMYCPLVYSIQGNLDLWIK